MATAELKSSPEKFVAFARALKGDETAPRGSAFAKPGGISQVVSERDDKSEARNIAQCIGQHGLGRRQEVEYRVAYQRSIEIEELDEESAPARTEARVIPVLLPGADEKRVPLFARQLHRVDLCASGDAKQRAAMQELVQAIIGTSGRLGGGF